MGAVLGVALLALAAGCSDAQTGAPVAAAGGTSAANQGTSPVPQTQPPTTTTSSGSTVSRPRTIDLKGVDACQVLAKLSGEFSTQGRTPSPAKSLGFPGNTECGVSYPDKGFTIGLTPVTTYDAEEFASMGRGQFQRITIAGFPAFTQNLGDANPACFAGVNVADGQMLYLQWLYNKSTGEPPTAAKCAEATKAMTAVMAVLGAS